MKHKYKIGDKILCSKDRMGMNGDIVHKKGKKYIISNIFDDNNKNKIIELFSEQYNTQYCLNHNKDSYIFDNHFNTQYTRLQKLKKLNVATSE